LTLLAEDALLSKYIINYQTSRIKTVNSHIECAEVHYKLAPGFAFSCCWNQSSVELRRSKQLGAHTCWPRDSGQGRKMAWA